MGQHVNAVLMVEFDYVNQMLREPYVMHFE